MKNFVKTQGLPSCETLSPNLTRVYIGAVTLAFSYKTLIAFSVAGKRVVHQNDWSTTTGKHLNAIDGGDKASRVSHAEFERLFDEMVGNDW